MIAGERVPAGLGYSTVLPDLDFETYSEAGYVWNDEAGKWEGPPGASGNTKGLPVVGAEPYAAHPTAEIICLAYDLKDGLGRRRWRPGLPPPADLLAHVASGGLIEAWNASFERWVWMHVCAARYGWPPMRDEQWRCAQAKARAYSLPSKLANAGAVLNVDVQKDSDGVRLMKLFSMPRNPTKTDPRRRILPSYSPPEILPGMRAPQVRRLVEEHADTLRYLDYNETDIASEAAVSLVVPDLEGAELAWWQTHERINQRGVHVDRVGVENCIAIIEQAFRQYNAELLSITGIDAASKVQQLIGWLAGRSTHLSSLDEDAVAEALERTLLPPDVRRVLEIRAAVGSASVKKLYAIRNRLSLDDRLRDLYVYYGARTGRSTGEGPQPTNLPKAGPDTIGCGQWVSQGDKRVFVEGSGCHRYYGLHLKGCPHCGRARYAEPETFEWNPDVAEDALQVIATRSLPWVEYVFGQALLTIAGCIRALFDAAPGHDLIGTDYNSIEAVGLAMISGEQWRINVFNTHGKIYEASAATMFKVPFEEFAEHKKRTGQHHPLRQKGKIGELAFGYQGWLGAAQAFGMPGTEEELKNDILAWRAASPCVEWLWGGQTAGKAATCVRNARAPGYEGALDDRLLWLYGLPYENRYDEFYFGVEGKAILAVLDPGKWYDVARLDGTHSGIEFYCDGAKRTLYCRLPSGRLLTYHSVVLLPSDRGGWAMSYEGNNTNPKNGPVGWIRMSTWGGRLVENIVQATCRDILAPACVALERYGYRVVLHVYDEIVAEVPEGVGSVEQFEQIVTVRPEWAADWPIRAPGGFRAKRYGKR